MGESCPTQERVTSCHSLSLSLMNESTCILVATPMDESYHTWTSPTTHEWVVSHIWMRHVTHINESWHTYEWVMSHTWTSPTTHEWVMSHIWMRHNTLMNESCHTYEWVMSHIWMSHVTHTKWMRHVKEEHTRRDIQKCIEIYTCMYMNIYA